MTTLAEFLLTRIAEDEAVARLKIHADGESGTNPGDGPQAAWLSQVITQLGGVALGTNAARVAAQIRAGVRAPTDPARVLAECEAKRRLIAAAESPMVVDPLPPGPPRDHQEGMWNGRFGGLYEAMQFLALPYADHSDYNEAWRP